MISGRFLLSEAWLENVHIDNEALIKLIRETVQGGGSILVGEDSVVSKLQSTK